MAKQIITTPIKNLSQLKTIDVIREAEVKAWACYRQKLAKKYRSVAGTKTINGIQVLNPIDLYSTLGDDSETSKLLDMLGIDEDNRKKMNEGQDEIDYMRLDWELTEDPTEATMKRWQKEIREDLSTVETITIRMTAYEQDSEPTTNDVKFPWEMGVGTKSKCDTVKPKNPYNMYLWQQSSQNPWKYNQDTKLYEFDKRRYTESMTISKTLSTSANGREDRWDETLKMLLLTSHDSLTILDETFSSVNRGGKRRVTTTVKIKANVKIHDEINKFSLDDTSSENKKMRVVRKSYYFSQGDNSDQYVDGYEDRYFGIMWKERERFWLENIETESKGLFVKPDGGRAYLSYEKLRNIDSETFQYYISTTMEVKYGNNDGFFVSFFKGLAAAIVGLLDAVINVFLHLPILGDLLRFAISTIGKLFGLSYEEALAVFKNIARIVLTMIMSYYLPMLNGELAGAWGGTINSVLTGSLSAMNVMPILYQLYGAVDQGLANVELDNERKETERLNGEKEEEVEIINMNATMGSVDEYDQLNSMMYNGMFELHENLGLGILPELPTTEKAKGEAINDSKTSNNI